MMRGLGAVRRLIGARLSREHRDAFFSVLNRLRAAGDFRGAIASHRALAQLLKDMRALRARKPLGSEADYLHFVYGFKQQEEFPFYAYLAIESARHHNPGSIATFCYVHEPTGPWWDAIKPTLSLLPMSDFCYFKGARFYHYAHKADVVRLLLLKELGGVYLDMDTLTIRSFAPLKAHDFGMAVQAGVHDASPGLCNAVMWGKPNAAFLRLWLKRYSSFRSKGRDDYWDFHSVKLPALLARDHFEKIEILDHRAFFYPLWTDVERILFSERGDHYIPDLSDAYGFHLWNGSTEALLRSLTPEKIIQSKSAYAHFARPVWLANDMSSNRAAVQ